MTDDRELIRATLRRLFIRLRFVRALTAGVRFLAAGLALAAVPLLLRSLLPGVWPWLAIGLIGGSTVIGLLYGALIPVRPERAARLADRQLGLKERMTAAAEYLASPVPPDDDMARAQIAETARTIRGLRTRDAIPLRLRAEAQLVGPLAAVVCALVLLPAVPIRLPEPGEVSGPPESPVAEEQARPLEQKLAPPALPKEVSPRAARQDAVRGPLAPHTQPGDQAAVFRDTKTSQERPDFGSFVKQGDDRLKLLARPEALPDLRKDYTQSPHQVMIRRMQQQLRAGNMQGLSWEQIERLLSELGQAEQRMGGGSDIADELMREMNDQRGRSPDKMMSALSRAMNRLRDRDAAGRGQGKGLRDAPSRQGAGEGKGDGEGGKEDGSPGGSAPGTEKSLQTVGDPTQRIGGDKQDATLEGDPREGPTESHDTNLSGLGARTPSRLQYLDVFGRYKKMMEEALTKEPIPFSYREQVKEYFKALEPH
jgi:hypothetical protein